MKRTIVTCIISVFFFSYSLAALPVTTVNFDESMSRNIGYDVQFAEKNDDWKIFKGLYESYRKEISSNRYSYSTTDVFQLIKKKLLPTSAFYKIPRFIHFIWLGSPLPERCKPLVESWKKMHPEWTVKVWTEADLDQFNLKNKEAFDKATNYGEKSDIWRYEILYRFGGVYVDTDFECLRPFDAIHQTCDLYAGASYGKEAILYNGLIGSIPNHPIIKACIDSIKVGPGDNNSGRIIQTTGPIHFTNCFLSLANTLQGKLVPFPVTFFYPFPNINRFDTQNHELIKQKWLCPESYALHYWATSWVKEETPEKKESKTTRERKRLHYQKVLK